jgi:thiosulfate/3-mercaptopyruvate sulfurtransferase
MTMDPLISTDWLAGQLDAPDLVVFDATKYLPTDGKDGAEEFARAHIPGARFFDIDVIADPDTALPHMVPSPGRFERLMGELGVSNTSRVVFYDQKGIASAPRGWWMMGLFGHDQAFVLDGGLPKWLREGRPTEAGLPAAPTPTTFQATLRATRLRGIGDMLAGGELVLDARPAGRFAGSAPEPRAGLPSGHIPGSRSVPSSSLLHPDGTMLDPAALHAAFAAAGADGTRPIVTSCGSGVTATILSLGLLRAGLSQGAVYDGSWTEWAGRPDTMKETD